MRRGLVRLRMPITTATSTGSCLIPMTCRFKSAMVPSPSLTGSSVCCSTITTAVRFASKKKGDKVDKAPAAKEAEPAVTTKSKLDDVFVEDETPETAQTKSTETETPPTPEAPIETEKVREETREQQGFLTETRQLLDIVARSLYTDKEVFIRELVSNSSDALEKRRQLALSHTKEYEPIDDALTIRLTVNQAKSQFVIQDNGIGMNKEELMKCLGTIASSGSKAFVEKLREGNKGVEIDTEKIIGQFGVGFYSSFMVATQVRVYSRSAIRGSRGYMWSSDGTGSYSLAEAEGVGIGTKILLEIKDTEMSFCTPQVVERVIKKYSNFVDYVIELNGKQVNTIEALWMKSKNEITEEQHTSFYQFIAHAYDKPQFRLHYAVDAPLSIRALFYIPQSHTERFGGATGRMESNINLYCRRVLIQTKAKHVLPEWLRFVKGAVDCDSLQLNVSREHTQDSALMRKLLTVLTTRVIKWFEEEAKRDSEAYNRFYTEFGQFLKEGVCTDYTHKNKIAKLLRYPSTADSSKSSSLEMYKERMKTDQSHIYYICAPSADLAKQSPYYEQYAAHGLEVLVLEETIDEFVMNHLESYGKFKLQNVETFDAEQDGHVQKTKDTKKDEDPTLSKKLSETQISALADFLGKRLIGRCGVIKATERLRDSPCIIADHESAQMRKLFKLSGNFSLPEPKYNMHFNPKHELIRKLYALSTNSDSEKLETAGLLAEQLFDNALMAAGLLEDPRSTLPRLTSLMTRMVKNVDELPPEA